MNISPTLGKVLYGLLFTIILPALLLVWAWTAEDTIDWPAVNSLPLGLAIASAGMGFMLWGWISLRVYGKGLPMNAYPPEQFVARGAFKVVSHPIYAGFCILAIGVAIASGSASGLWLISPVLVLGCIALVLGYEGIALRSRFPGSRTRPLLTIPPDTEERPTFSSRLSTWVLLLLPWFVLVQISQYLAPQPARMLSEELLDYPSLEGLYLLAPLFVLLVPLIAPTGKVLREFFISGIWAGGLAFLAAMLLPSWFGFSSATLPGQVFSLQGPGGIAWSAWLTIQALWFILALRVYAQAFPKGRYLWGIFATAGVVGSLFTGVHDWADLGLEIGCVLVAINRGSIWEATRSASEAIANSWKEWQFGPLRVINHGFYAGAAGFFGILLVGSITGEAYIWSIGVFAVTSLIVAGLWAQLIEGSEKLKRPFGYYGGLAGAFIASGIMYLMGTSIWLMLAAFSVGMPIGQAIGRLRCLVNGCCHGSRTQPNIGIRYYHPRSRVCKISGLKGESLHPTPVYSILWLLVMQVVLLKLWFSAAPLSLITGLYFLLAGLGRFVEEAYRGEPQTPIWNGLRLYQWTAILSIVIGALMTTIRIPMPALAPGLSVPVVVAATLIGLFAMFLMGVDFPKSNARFSRLA